MSSASADIKPEDPNPCAALPPRQPVTTNGNGNNLHTHSSPTSSAPTTGAATTNPPQRAPVHDNMSRDGTHRVRDAHNSTAKLNGGHVQAADLAIRRVLSGTHLPSVDADKRLSQQLRYVENINIPELKSHSTALRKFFLDILRLQREVPTRGRFHLLYESQQPTSSSHEVVKMEFHSLFSTTICGETEDHRDTTRLLGELLLDFNCLSLRVPDTNQDDASASPHSNPTTSKPHSQHTNQQRD